MNDATANKRSTICYWEWRRLIYNLLLVPPALVGYFVSVGSRGGMWEIGPQYFYLLFRLAVAALEANICYSFVYALEFLFGSEKPDSRWQRFGRMTVFVAGVLLAVCLALRGGYDIGEMAFFHRFPHA
jgi:hypothetical protein